MLRIHFRLSEKIGQLLFNLKQLDQNKYHLHVYINSKGLHVVVYPTMRAIAEI